MLSNPTNKMQNAQKIYEHTQHEKQNVHTEKDLLDDERTIRANDDVDEIKVAISNLLNLDVVEVVPELRVQGGHGFYVLDQRLLVQRPELCESHCDLWAVVNRVAAFFKSKNEKWKCLVLFEVFLFCGVEKKRRESCDYSLKWWIQWIRSVLGLVSKNKSKLSIEWQHVSSIKVQQIKDYVWISIPLMNEKWKSYYFCNR